MRKVIAAINMTLDSFCDHNVIIPDEDLHYHYMNLLNEGDIILYGRKTYELMEFWRSLLTNPSEYQSMNDFAISIDKITKIVFSNTLKNVDWSSAILADKSISEIVSNFKNQDGRSIFVGSRSLINQLTNLKMIDEYQICIHPVLVGKGLSLFDDINERNILKLTNTKILKSGAVILYYNADNH